MSSTDGVDECPTQISLKSEASLLQKIELITETVEFLTRSAPPLPVVSFPKTVLLTISGDVLL